MAAILGAITTHQKALHLRSLVLVGLEKFRNHGAIETPQHLPDDVGVLDDVVSSPLMPIVVQLHGFAADIAHKPSLLPAARRIEADQFCAELGFEHVGKHENWRLHFKARKTLRRRQGSQVLHELLRIAAIRPEWQQFQDAQGRIEHYPDAPQGDIALGGFGIVWNGAVAPADRTVEVPKKAIAWGPPNDASSGLVRRIDADPKKCGALIIKQLRVGERDIEVRFALCVGGAEKAQHDVAPCHAIEGKGIARRGPRFEPRGGFADLQVSVFGHGKMSLATRSAALSPAQEV